MISTKDLNLVGEDMDCSQGDTNSENSNEFRSSKAVLTKPLALIDNDTKKNEEVFKKKRRPKSGKGL